MAEKKPAAKKTATKTAAKNAANTTKNAAKVADEPKVAEIVKETPRFTVKVELPAPLVSEMTREAKLRGLSVERFIEAIFAVFQQRT